MSPEVQKQISDERIESNLHLEKAVCAIEAYMHNNCISNLQALKDAMDDGRGFLDRTSAIYSRNSTRRQHDQRKYEKENQSGETQRTHA